MRVSVETQPVLRVGTPTVLFQGKFLGGVPFGRNYDITPDSAKFLMILDEGQDLPGTRYSLVVNWFEELEQIMAGER